MKKQILIPIVLVVLLAVAASAVFASSAVFAEPQYWQELWKIRKATWKYSRIEAAEEDGFVPLFDCIAHPGDPSQGAMGIHYIQPNRFDDQLDLEQPEVLVYEPRADGGTRLVAVEYVIPAAAWPEDAPPPEFLGQELHYKTTMGKYGKEDGIDPYYEVHAWAWKYNPSGRLFADWNPRVSCSN